MFNCHIGIKEGSMEQGSLGIISNLEEHYLTRMKDCNEY